VVFRDEPKLNILDKTFGVRRSAFGVRRSAFGVRPIVGCEYQMQAYSFVHAQFYIEDA
jgi:hypothetical protein